MKSESLSSIFSHFTIAGSASDFRPFGNGHINDTFRVAVKTEEHTQYYLLQRINHYVFNHPDQVMDNIKHVTEFLKKKIIVSGGNPLRETLTIISASDGKPFFKDNNGEFWRVCLFINGARTYDIVPSEKIFYESAFAFGHFQHLLSDYPADTLYETIPNFHNTVKRFENFKNAVQNDRVNRLHDVKEEVSYLTERSFISHILIDRLRNGQLPLRVTHNDTKLNNVMIDNTSEKAICVIDLDTVMPGLSVLDFGDAIRFGASTSVEDEPDLSKVHLDLHLFDIYTHGFIDGLKNSLTDEEYKMLPYGALVITYEQALRFLEDYLNGDTYYKINRSSQNLDRARTQIKLLKEMENSINTMIAITEKYRRER